MSDKAKRIKILDMLAGYPSLVGASLGGLTSAMVLAVADYDLDAVARACERFLMGKVAGHNSAFPPTAAELAEQARLHHDAAHPKVVQLHNGLIDMDFGHGRIDMRGLSTAEQDQIIKLGGRTPDGRNIALLSLDEKRASLRALPAPSGRVTPKLQRMSK